MAHFSRKDLVVEPARNLTPTTRAKNRHWLAISRREEELETALKDVVRAADARASLGHYVSRYPWQVLFGGLMLGIWLERRR